MYMQTQFNLPYTTWETFRKISRYLSSEVSMILTFELFIAPREVIKDGELSLFEWQETQWHNFNLNLHIQNVITRLKKENNFANEALKQEMLTTLENLKFHYPSVA
jgi:hypothetical protein